MIERWIRGFRKQLGIPGLHLSTDRVDSCQHVAQRLPGALSILGGPCWPYCNLYRARHKR